MRWHLATRFDPRGAALADRHYSRLTVGSSQFMPSGKTVVLVTAEGDAVWGSSWQISADGTAMAFHAWPRAWVCSIFRNESPHLSSELVREAVAATRSQWGEPPEQGMITFIDAGKVRPKRDPGRCFLRAGFRRVADTSSGKITLQLLPGEMPAAEAPLGGSDHLFAPAPRQILRRRIAPGRGIVDA